MEHTLSKTHGKAAQAIITSAKKVAAPTGEKLLEAAGYGTPDKVKALLDSGIDVNARLNDHGDTALMMAADRANEANIKFLLSYPNIDIDAQNNNGDTALILAAAYGSWPISVDREHDSTEAVQLLLAKNANTEVKDKKSLTALKVASGYGPLSTVEALVNKGAEVNAKDDMGETPLVSAAHIGSPEIAEFLLSNGADINSKNEYGSTPLMEAAGFMDLMGPNLGVLPVLLKHKGIDLNAQISNDAPAEWVRGWTALMFAAYNAADGFGAVSDALLQKVQLILEAGAKTSIKSADGRTAYDIAADESRTTTRAAALLKKWRKKA